MFDVSLRSEIVTSIISSLNKISSIIFFFLIVLSLMSTAVEPLYCWLCGVLRWNKFEDPAREVIKFCVKATMAELVFFTLTSDKALMEYIRLFNKIVNLGG